MTRLAIALLVLAPLPLVAPAPAAAQASGVTQRYIEVYGNDPCPQSSDTEIVVCARKPESERYRIPPRFRAQPGNGPNESWAEKAESIEYVGRSGTGSCSPSGAGGWTGCWSQMMEQAKAERRQAVKDDANIP